MGANRKCGERPLRRLVLAHGAPAPRGDDDDVNDDDDDDDDDDDADDDEY